jgi:RNA polymerase primary sigma factor
MANVRLVAHVARRYNNRGLAPTDLLQEGFTGLLLAIDRFNPVNQTRLATYAVWWIRQAVQRAVAAGAYPVRLNPKQVQRLARAQQAITNAQNPLASQSEPASQGRGCLPATRLDLAAIRTQISLDAPCHGDGSTRLADLMVFAPEHDEHDDTVEEYLGAMIQKLNPREQFVLKLRFGLDGEPRHSLSQISKVLNVSKERIRQIEERALQKLRTAATCQAEAPSRDVRPAG